MHALGCAYARALRITLTSSKSFADKTRSSFLHDGTFPSSMNVFSDDVTSFSECLIATFEDQRPYFVQQNVKAKKYYSCLHQRLSTQFSGG